MRKLIVVGPQVNIDDLCGGPAGVANRIVRTHDVNDVKVFDLASEWDAWGVVPVALSAFALGLLLGTLAALVALT